MRASTLMYAAGFLIVGMIGYQLVRKGKQLGEAAGAALSDLGEALNPISDQNIFYRAANAVTQAVTGEPEISLGSKIWEWLNPDQAAADNVAATGSTAAGGRVASPEALSDYWQQFRDPSYLDRMAVEEKKVIMKNLKIPIRDQAGNLVIGP